jgi:hypothetical protein
MKNRLEVITQRLIGVIYYLIYNNLYYIKLFDVILLLKIHLQRVVLGCRVRKVCSQASMYRSYSRTSVPYRSQVIGNRGFPEKS